MSFRMVEVTELPTRTAPANSAMAAIQIARLRVMTPLPIEGAIEFATSLAPIFQAM